jgi:hypothetical protein
MIIERRTRSVDAPADMLFRSFVRLGGDRGWLAYDWAWHLRGGETIGAQQRDAGQPGGKTYLASRWLANILKLLGYAIMALLAALILRTGDAKKALVRAWRSCGYLYQIPRSLVGKI